MGIKAPKESDVVRSVLEYLKVGCKWLCWRNNTGSFAGEYKGRKWFVRAGHKGSGDIFLILPGGRFASIETSAGLYLERAARWRSSGY